MANARNLGLILSALGRHIRRDWMGGLVPLRPVVLRLLANNVCDSRCVMCGIWKNGADADIGTEAIQTMLRDSRLAGIERVVLTGGEPTLRPDLAEIAELLCRRLPKLTSIELMTNAVNEGQVIQRSVDMAEVLRGRPVAFKLAVSLDGVGDDHDRNRGVTGNFDRAVNVIDAARNAGIDVGVRCTLTSSNVEGADDLLAWCEENRIDDWCFSVAMENPEFNNYGYSRDASFTPSQRFHAMMFFEQLVRQRSLSLQKRTYYERLRDWLARGDDAQPARFENSRSVTLNMQGEAQGADGQYGRESIAERPGNLEWDMVKQRARDVVITRNNARTRKIALNELGRQKRVPASKASPADWTHVLITGWYGTETAGDKAILGELLHFIRRASPRCRITVTTLNQHISVQSRRELSGLADAALVDMAMAHEPDVIEQVDAVVIGGGPLMESQAMGYIWRIFAEANRQAKARIVFGCGVGPIHSDQTRRLVASVLTMSTAGFFRDRESLRLAVELSPGRSFDYACDPAFAYVRRWHCGNDRQDESGDMLAGLLRANTKENRPGDDGDTLRARNIEAASVLARILEGTAARTEQAVQLLAMNTPWVGGDDRLFNRAIRDKAVSDEAGLIGIERGYLELDELLAQLSTASSAIAMRYHGHVFCTALGIPYLSIDYTGKPGKVNSLVTRLDYQQFSEDWGSIGEKHAIASLETLHAQRDEWSGFLLQCADRLVERLQATYERVFWP